MIQRTIDLNGQWQAEGYDKDGSLISFPGTVPGCVHTDLMNCGMLPDIYYRDNSKLCQWVEQGDFTYKRSFTLEELPCRAYIEFDGLDTYCDVFLNGKKIGKCDNMFLSYAFPVDGILRLGENTLEVRFRSPIKEVEGCPPRKGCFTTERMNTRRIQCTYGWDWVDRFVTEGIYRDVRLVFRKDNRIDSVYLYTESISSYAAEVRLEINIADFVRCGERVRIELTAPDGRCLFSKERTVTEPTIYERVFIKDPELWYPLGYGEQPLYRLSVSGDSSGYGTDFGIRTVTVLETEDERGSKEEALCQKMREYPHLCDIDKNERGASFTVLVNGVKVMCKGANWVPCEPFPSFEGEEKITRLLTLAADCGINMLRVWGGGIFEKEHFYRECTRLGILVTQDFLMACGSYPEDEEWFIDSLRQEAQCAAQRLRNHTCLCWWTGDNENAVDGNENITDFPGYRSATYGIAPVLRRLDPHRLFLPSSPYGGDKYSSATRGTAHVSNFMGEIYHRVLEGDLSDYREYFSRFTARFIAEQPTMGMPFLSSLRRFMSDGDIFGEDESISEYHTKHNPDLGEISLYTFVREFARKLFGEYRDGADRLLKMQMLQCQWVRQSFELARRNKWFSSGILFWMFNDCWPAANGWSLVDYYACPKPAYYAFKRCASPLIASIDKKDDLFEVFVCNDSLKEKSGTGSLYLCDLERGGTRVSFDFDFKVAAGESSVAKRLPVSEISPLADSSTVLLCDISAESGERDRAFYLEGRFSDTSITYEAPRIVDDDGEYVTVKSESFNPFAIIDAPYLLEENAFVIRAGEIKRIRKLQLD